MPMGRNGRTNNDVHYLERLDLSFYARCIPLLVARQLHHCYSHFRMDLGHRQSSGLYLAYRCDWSTRLHYSRIRTRSDLFRGSHSDVQGLHGLKRSKRGHAGRDRGEG